MRRANRSKPSIEQDKRDASASDIVLYKLTDGGRKEVLRGSPIKWGQFLRYNYFTFDFSKVSEPGMYEIGYRGGFSHAFKIDARCVRPARLAADAGIFPASSDVPYVRA